MADIAVALMNDITTLNTLMLRISAKAYKLAGKTDFRGLPISIETKKGQTREGVGADGKPWKVIMPFDYGYIRGTEGADNQHVDCFIGPDKDADEVYVIHQCKEDDPNKYDEDKVMLGFGSLDEAIKAYKSAYTGVDLFKGSHTFNFADFVDELHKKSNRGKALECQNSKYWYGFDLDGTLAKWDGFKGDTVIGKPIKKMIAIIKDHLAKGDTCKIFTARVHDDKDGKIEKAIQAWCKKYIGQVLEITNAKDPEMVMLYDDRATGVEKNTGKLLSEPQLKAAMSILAAAEVKAEQWQHMRKVKEHRMKASNWRHNPIPVMDKPLSARAFKELPLEIKEHLAKTAPMAYVNPRFCVTNQPYVLQASIEYFAKGGKEEKKPLLLLTEEGLYVHNGNHRATSALVCGRELYTRVIDVRGLHAGGPGSGWTTEGGHIKHFHPMPGSDHSEMINGLAMKAMKHPDFKKLIDKAIHEPEKMPVAKGSYQDSKTGELFKYTKHQAAGVIVVEPDNKVWLYSPKNNFGGYKNTFSKGTLDKGEDPQLAAVRELHEETGLVAKIKGYLGDVERDTSITRYYIGQRVGGAPWAHDGKETESVHLVPIDEKLFDHLRDIKGNHTADAKVADLLMDHIEKHGLPESLAHNEDYTAKSTGGIDYLEKQIGGQGGSNKGGIFKGSDGIDRYVKFYKDMGQGRAEATANTIYNDLGVKAPVSTIIDAKGKEAFASEIIPGGKTLEKEGLTKDNCREVLKGFAADVLTANWDAVGLTHDNILMKGGEPVRIDNGSAFTYRAQGGAKPTSLLTKISEFEGLANPSINHEYSRVFKTAGYKSATDIPDIKEQVQRIVDLQQSKGGWGEYLTHKAPYLTKDEHKQFVDMLESKTELLMQRVGVKGPSIKAESELEAGGPGSGWTTENGHVGHGSVTTYNNLKKAGYKPVVNLPGEKFNHWQEGTKWEHKWGADHYFVTHGNGWKKFDSSGKHMASGQTTVQIKQHLGLPPKKGSSAAQPSWKQKGNYQSVPSKPFNTTTGGGKSTSGAMSKASSGAVVSLDKIGFKFTGGHVITGPNKGMEVWKNDADYQLHYVAGKQPGGLGNKWILKDPDGSTIKTGSGVVGNSDIIKNLSTPKTSAEPVGSFMHINALKTAGYTMHEATSDHNETTWINKSSMTHLITTSKDGDWEIKTLGGAKLADSSKYMSSGKSTINLQNTIKNADEIMKLAIQEGKNQGNSTNTTAIEHGIPAIVDTLKSFGYKAVDNPNAVVTVWKTPGADKGDFITTEKDKPSWQQFAHSSKTYTGSGFSNAIFINKGDTVASLKDIVQSKSNSLPTGKITPLEPKVPAAAKNDTLKNNGYVVFKHENDADHWTKADGTGKANVQVFPTDATHSEFKVYDAKTGEELSSGKYGSDMLQALNEHNEAGYKSTTQSDNNSNTPVVSNTKDWSIKTDKAWQESAKTTVADMWGKASDADKKYHNDKPGGVYKQIADKLGVPWSSLKEVYSKISDWQGGTTVKNGNKMGEWCQQIVNKSEQVHPGMYIEYLVHQERIKETGGPPTLYRGLTHDGANEDKSGANPTKANVKLIQNLVKMSNEFSFNFPMYGAEGFSSNKSTSTNFGGVNHGGGICIVKPAGTIPVENIISSRDLNPGMWTGFAGEHEWAVAYPDQKMKIDTEKGDKVITAAGDVRFTFEQMMAALNVLKMNGWDYEIEDNNITIIPPADMTNAAWFAQARKPSTQVAACVSCESGDCVLHAGGPGSGRTPYKVGDRVGYKKFNVKIAQALEDGHYLIHTGANELTKVHESKLYPLERKVAPQLPLDEGKMADKFLRHAKQQEAWKKDIKAGGQGSGWTHEGGHVSHKTEDGPVDRLSKEQSRKDQKVAESYEPVLAKLLGGKHYPDSEPMDVIIRNSGRLIGVECKVLIYQKNDKLTMNKGAIPRKLKWAKKTGGEIYTVAIDTRDKQTKFYFRPGVGSWHLKDMKLVNSLGDLKKLLGVKGASIKVPDKFPKTKEALGVAKDHKWTRPPDHLRKFSILKERVGNLKAQLDEMIAASAYFNKIQAGGPGSGWYTENGHVSHEHMNAGNLHEHLQSLSKNPLPDFVKKAAKSLDAAGLDKRYFESRLMTKFRTADKLAIHPLAIANYNESKRMLEFRNDAHKDDVTHELAHHLDLTFLRKPDKQPGDKMVINKALAAKVISDYTSEWQAAKDAMKETIGHKFNFTNDYQKMADKPGLQKNIPTLYALDSAKEWFAESLSLYAKGGQYRDRLERIAPKTAAAVKTVLTGRIFK